MIRHGSCAQGVYDLTGSNQIGKIQRRINCNRNLKHRFPGGSDGKESACNTTDLGSIPGSGRYPGEGNGNPLSILAWRIPWTEEPGELQSMGSQRFTHD